MENLKDKAALSRQSLPAFERTYSVPTSPTSPNYVSGLPSPINIPARASESTLVGGQSHETARRPVGLHHSMTMPLSVPASEVQDFDDEPPFQEHRFVKSTFSKGEFLASETRRVVDASKPRI